MSPELNPTPATSHIDQESKETKRNLEISPISEYFWKSVREGVYIPIPETKVDELVDLYTNIESSLSDDEMSILRKRLRDHFTYMIEDYNEKTRLLVEGFVYIVPPIVYKQRERTGCTGDRAVYLLNENDTSLEKMGYNPTTTEEKIAYFSEPSFWDNSTFIKVERGGSSSSGSYFIPGSRSLYEYNYSDDQEFLKHVESIKTSTGKDKLRMLDVGGNLGHALNDAKEVDPSIETFNMTIDEAPSIHGDHIVRYPAELMPAEFEEGMDIIESNVAFRYFAFPDIALKNIIKTLSVGGSANIDFQADRSCTPRNELKDRLEKVFDLVKQLEEDGFISVEYGRASRLHVGYDQIPWYVQVMYGPGRMLHIKKNKSTSGLVL